MERPATYWMLQPIRKYATFSGRARRAEYWWYILLYTLIYTGATLIDIALLGLERVLEFGIGPMTGIVTLALLLPGIALTVRRLHDRDKSGWWLLIALIPVLGGLFLLIQYVQRGTDGPNRFGPDPLGPDVGTVFE